MSKNVVTMPDLERALNAESWQWLEDNFASLADAVKAETQRGASPEDIRRFVFRKTDREALAKRCEQAAAFLAEKK